MPISDIAARENISEAYLEQLAARLKKAGMITSQRGAQGGYLLAADPDEVSAGDILRVMEGSLDAASCPGLMEEGCAGARTCVTKYVWQKINESITSTVDSISLKSLMDEYLAVKGGEQ